MLVVRSDAHRQHHCLELDGTQLIPSWESPARAEHVDTALDAIDGFSFVAPADFDRALADSVHDSEYVSFLESAWDEWQRLGHTAPAAMAIGWPARRFRDVKPRHLEAQLGYYSFAADCSIAEGTWTAATQSAAIADTAAQAVARGADATFARCRPPGHHASRDQFGGYCYLNNAAIAAQRLRNEGAARVAILDVDYHHGNGTQDIFYDRDDVRFCSIHADPRDEFPYFLGHGDETGVGPGLGHNRNIALPRGTSASTWFESLDEAHNWLLDPTPDALVVSLGLDTFVHDPISHFELAAEDFDTLGRRVAAFDLPTVMVMEGGYATAQLGENMARVLTSFADSR